MTEEPILTHTSPAAPSALSREQWDEIARRLQEPFDPNEVDFRVQGKVNEQTGRAQVVAYIDARAVQDRLDAVVGAGGWSFDWTPLVIDHGEVQVAKGVLTIYGVAKADAGSASNFEQSLGAVSHCFKRAAVHWGIGRYLYNLPMAWVAVERGRISDQVLSDLRARLPRPSGAAAASAPAATLPARPAAERETRPASTPTQPTPAPRNRATTRDTATARGASEAPARPATSPSAASARLVSTGEQPATEQQLNSLGKLCEALGRPAPDPGLRYGEARQLIVQLSGDYQRARKAS